MKTITIDIINDKVIRLLKDLELLKLIRLHKEKKQPLVGNLVQRYKGEMTKQPLDSIDNQLNELRSGWE